MIPRARVGFLLHTLHVMRVASSASRNIIMSGSAAQSAIVFLHGSGDNGPNFKRWIGLQAFVKKLAAEGVHVEFPTAVPISYTLFRGRKESVWFDRLEMDPSSPEQTASVEQSVGQLESLLDDLVASGVLPSRIAIGGFSMGGGIALQTALRSKHALAGVFAMSSYMCDDAAVYRLLEEPSWSARSPPLRIWMAHGANDDFVLPAWGQSTAKRLSAVRGLEVSWRTYPRLRHELRSDELDDLNAFLTPLVLVAQGQAGSEANDSKEL
jgi:phospholipase/carboxylesterase